MGSNFDNIDTGVYGIKRYWAVVYVFKFYNSDNVVFDCLVHVCPSGSSACDAVSTLQVHYFLFNLKLLSLLLCLPPSGSGDILFSPVRLSGRLTVRPSI